MTGGTDGRLVDEGTGARPGGEGRIGRAALRGSIVGFVLFVVGAGGLGLLCGMGLGGALGLGVFTGLWGGPGFGGMFGAIMASERESQHR